MAEIVKMPRLSDTMTEGVVSKWHKKEGDEIKEGDLLADIETDKATMEFESFQEGFLLYIGVKESESAPVDSILAILGQKDEDISSLLDQANNKSESDTNGLIKKDEEDINSLKNLDLNQKIKTPSFSNDEQRLKISPLARRIANEKGIDINVVKGSGDSGRIIKRDLEGLDNNLDDLDNLETSCIWINPRLWILSEEGFIPIRDRNLIGGAILK